MLPPMQVHVRYITPFTQVGQKPPGLSSQGLCIVGGQYRVRIGHEASLRLRTTDRWLVFGLRGLFRDGARP